ncbi:MAG: Na+/H+ antiporter subunit E [Acidobacteriota bacterium]
MDATETPTGNRASAAAYVFVTVSALWLLWSGHFSFEHPLLLGLGLASSTLVTYLCWRMGICDGEIAPIRWFFQLWRYVPWLVWQVVLSAVATLRLGLGPKEKVDPVVVTLEAGQRTDLGLVTYANSITLTPGTLTLDSDAAARTIRVHAMNEPLIDDLRGGEMGRRIEDMEARAEGLR